MSSPPTASRQLFEHLLAFTLAWVAASWLFLHVLRPITVSQPDPGMHIPILGKGQTAVRNLIYLSAALRGGRTLVVLGSSELDHKPVHSYLPDVFFPAHHLANVLTYGSSGFDALGMYGLLYSLRPHLNTRTRLVILLSPAWFRRGDLTRPVFDQNLNDSVLLQDYWSDEPREVLHDYLLRHQFESPDFTSSEQLFLDDPESILDWNFPEFIGRTINVRAYAQREKLNLLLTQQRSLARQSSAGSGVQLPWDRYAEDARSRQLILDARQQAWLRSTLYQQHTRSPKIGRRNFYPQIPNSEPQMSALRDLLHMLWRSKVKALFVMLPINPTVYADVGRFDSINAHVAVLCGEYGMSYFDMYSQPYEEGLLRDPIHPGMLGWEHIDRQVTEFFHL